MAHLSNNCGNDENKKGNEILPNVHKAEREGFEPSFRTRRKTVFETVPFNHSGISPCGWQRSYFFSKLLYKNGRREGLFTLFFVTVYCLLHCRQGDVYVELINQPGSKVLLYGIYPATDANVFSARRNPRFFQVATNAIVDKIKHCRSFLHPRVSYFMC